MTGWLLIVFLLVLGGILSTLGDLLGSRIGKARLSVFNLRPRRTAILITILTGSLISSISLSLMLLVSRQLRVGLFELDDIQEKLKDSKAAILPLQQQRQSLELKIDNAQKELVKLSNDLFNFRKGQVVITSGQSLATVTVKLGKESDLQEEIENILRKANFYAFIRVKPGEIPNKRLVLVRRDHISLLEKKISDKREWVVNIRSAGNVLLGESYVYAFPEAALNKNIVRKGEIIASLNISYNDISRASLDKQTKILLASTLAEVKRRGSLITEIHVDSNSLLKLLNQLEVNKNGFFKLNAIAETTSTTAEKISVALKVSRKSFD